MEGYSDHRGRTGHLYFFFIFLLTVRRIRMSFSLKPFLSQGDHPSKFQLAGVRRFGGVREQTNKRANSLTDWRFYRVIYLGILKVSAYSIRCFTLFHPFWS